MRAATLEPFVLPQLDSGIGMTVLDEHPNTDAETRIAEYAGDSNLVSALAAMTSRREAILNRWLEAAVAQPFHHRRHDHAIADHIPALFDALMEYMEQAAPRSSDPDAPLESAAIQSAAQGHALMRAEQGLQPADVLAEFRLLRHELGHALRQGVPDSAPTGDVVSAELLMNDALDGAAALALSALTARMEQLREEFLATTVHEVRQPVTSIAGHAQLADRLLGSSTPDVDRAREALRHIRDAVNQMDSLLTTLIDSSQTALGGLVLQPSTFDLAGIISRFLEQLDPETAARIEVQLPPDVSLAGHWDGPRLTQVIGNLLSNAAKYSAPETPIILAVEATKGSVALTVRDRGIGIPNEDLPRLFNRYARAGNAVEQHIDGLGLGLYLCRSIVEAHGGRIWADSPGRDQGTSVSIALPRSDVTSA